jgi:hypothetical protein
VRVTRRVELPARVRVWKHFPTRVCSRVTQRVKFHLAGAGVGCYYPSGTYLLPSLHMAFPDLLAFAATCHLWRSAFSSYPYKSTLYRHFLPLLLNPIVSFCSLPFSKCCQKHHCTQTPMLCHWSSQPRYITLLLDSSAFYRL